ncbi:MAG: glycosyltransferase family 2 protein [Victivallaceae bacterium]|nr:glycosyltransferase family 2 protein [Victivallaceae bacterium]
MNSEIKKIRTGIIVLNWNGCRDTLACLESLAGMNCGENLEVIIYVVDNGSEECSPEIFREKYPRIELIVNSSNQGYTEGNNIGIRKAIEAGCRYVILLNNDTEVDPGFVNEMVAVAESDQVIGIVTPKLLFWGWPSKIQYAGGKLRLNRVKNILIGYGEEDKGQYDYRGETAFCTGTSVLLRVDMLKQTGLLAKEYFAYHEDSEICLRAVRAGYKLFYTGKTFVLHKESRSFGGYMNPTSFYYSTRNFFFLVKKYGSVSDKISCLIYVLFFYWAAVLGYSVVKRQPGLFTYFCRACRDFLGSRQGQLM